MLGMFHLCLASTLSQSVDLQAPEGYFVGETLIT